MSEAYNTHGRTEKEAHAEFYPENIKEETSFGRIKCD
jgi:hypothetical protein